MKSFQRIALSGLIALLGTGFLQKSNALDLSGQTNDLVNVVFTNFQGNASADIQRNVEYKFNEPSVLGNGGINYERSSDGWYPAGSILNLEATNSPYYTFSSWSGQTNSTNSNLQVIIDQPNKNLTANFTPILTEKGTPHYWLVEKQLGFDDMFITNNYALWQHYQLDTDPTNPEGYFHTRIQPGNLILTNTSSKVVYNIDKTESLNPLNWENYTNNILGEIGETKVPITQNGFYRGSGKRIQE